MVSFSESKNQLPLLKLFWTHIQGFHLLLVIEIIWTKKHDLPNDANKCLRAAAHWLPLRGQLEPHCSLRKCVTPHVVCGAFHRLFPAMNNTTENAPDECEPQPKASLNLNLIISGLLVLMAKKHRAVLDSLTICFLLEYFPAFGSTPNNQTSAQHSCAVIQHFKLKVPCAVGCTCPGFPPTQLSLIHSSTHPNSHGILLKACDWCHYDARRCCSITDRCQLLRNAVQTF